MSKQPYPMRVVAALLIAFVLLGGCVGYYARGAPSPNPNPSQIGNVYTGLDAYLTGKLTFGALGDVELSRTAANTLGLGAGDSLQVPSLSANRPVITDTGGLLGTDAGFTYNATTNTLTVPNLSVTNASNVYQSYVKGYYPGNPQTYTIGINGTTYWLRGEGNGDLTTGTNATLILQSAVDAITTRGDIFIKAGTYTSTGSYVTLDDNISISGEGETATILDSIELRVNCENVTIRDIGFTGSPPNAAVYIITGANNVDLENLYAKSILGTYAVFYIYGSVGTTINSIRFTDLTSIDSDGMGFMISSAGNNQGTISDVWWVRCKSYNAGLAATRNNDFVTGFDITENPKIENIWVIDCLSDSSWESGFHLEESPTKINVNLSNCISNDNGQKPVPTYGFGYMISANVTLLNCRGDGNTGGLYQAKNTAKIISGDTNIVTVSTTGGTYTKLSDAFTAITTASSVNPFIIKVSGVIIETSAITAKSYIDVIGPATIICNSASTLNAVNLVSITNSLWKDLTIQRSGAVGGASHVVAVTGTTDSTIQFENCIITNSVTGVGSCYGVYTIGTTTPKFTGCTITGGNGGTSSHGFYAGILSAPIVENCIITGGGAGDGSFGFNTDGFATPDIALSIITGGGGGADCYGFDTMGSSTPTITDCTITGGAGGGGVGLMMTDSSAPIVSSSTIVGDGTTTSTSWAYDDADNGRFRPYATPAYMLTGIYVSVTNAAAGGTTLSIGNSVGGTQIATGIAISSTGSKYFAFTRTEQAAAGYLYATPSAGIADGSLTIYYEVRPNAATYGRAVYIDTRGYARITESNIYSNGASNALYISDVSEAANAWKISQCHIETMDPVGQKSVQCESAYVGVPIYKSIFIGPFTNVSGLANENSGTQATTIAVAATTITHNLGYTPVAGDIMLTPTTSTFNCTSYAITAYSSTTFTITTYDATGAAKGSSSAITFAWRANKYS